MTNTFRLEDVFPDVNSLFTASEVASASSQDTLIVVDTNVLLLPYTIRKDGLATLESFYQELRDAGRLFLPARVAREFIINRDKKLAELIKTLGDVKSRINIGERNLAPILEGVEGSEDIDKASKELSEAKKMYTKAVDRIEKTVRGWSGNDPVTNIYRSVFDAENIVTSSDEREALEKEWDIRRENRIPPGYKDGSKEDTGIGDFLVWKSILQLGQTRKQDLIFVTGDEKSDWFVRSNGEGIYPRPELIAEYRQLSQGKNVRLAELHEVLREMEVSDDVVEQIEVAENSANEILRARAATVEARHPNRKLIASASAGVRTDAEFRMPYGGAHVVFSTPAATFEIQLSEQRKDSLWVYPNNRDNVGRIEIGTIGDTISNSIFPTEEEAFGLKKGQILRAKNKDGYTLIARLLEANSPRSGENFEVRFIFTIFSPNSGLMIP